MARRLRYATNTPSREMNMLTTPKTIEIVLSEDTMIMLIRSYSGVEGRVTGNAACMKLVPRKHVWDERIALACSSQEVYESYIQTPAT